MQKRFLKTNIFSVTVLFLLGETAALIPNVLSFKAFICFLLFETFIISFAVLYDKKIIGFLKANTFFGICVAVIISAYAIYCIKNTVSLFAEVFEKFALSEFSFGGIAVILIILSLYTAFKGYTALKKTATLFLAVSVFFIFIITAVSLKEFETDNFISVYKAPANFNFSVFFTDFFPVELLPFYFCLSGERKYKKSLYSGLLWGGIFSAILGIIPLLIFGRSFCLLLEFPVFEAVSALSIGTVFTRIDALLYFIFFSGSLIKSGFLFLILLKTFKYLFNKIKIPALKNQDGEYI